VTWHRTKGTLPVTVDLPYGLNDRLRDHCARQGTSLSYEVRLAIRRHLAYPPAEGDVPPLPDGVRPHGRPKKAGRKQGKK
jgi:hypothetical protein